jgi:hypothetical protein
LTLHGASNKDAEWREEKEETSSPQRLAELIVHEPKALAQVSVSKGLYEIRYNIDPWLLTTGTARSISLNFAIDLTISFFDKFADAKQVSVIATATFKDIRGHESFNTFNVIEFSKQNASTIKFDAINHSDIPALADGYWEHPAVSH